MKVLTRIMMQLPDNKKIAYLSLMIALSLIFSYIETLIPLNFGIAGVKIGLANIISVIALYLLGFGYSLFIVIIRVILSSGFIFINSFLQVPFPLPHGSEIRFCLISRYRFWHTACFVCTEFFRQK